MKALLLAAVLTLTAGASRARPEPFDPFGAAGIDPRPGAQVPLDGAFRDADGRTVTLAQLAHGKPIVLAPVQHRCPNLCGLTLDGLRTAVAGQTLKPGRDFALVALGIDPREGPQEASLSARRLPGAHALTGPEPQITAVTSALGYRFAWDRRIGQYAHVAGVAVLSPNGRLSHWLYGVAPAAADLHLALEDAGAGRARSWGEQIRLLCYHFDPRSGRYDGQVAEIARWLGGGTAAALALMVTVLAWRGGERRRA